MTDTETQMRTGKKEEGVKQQDTLTGGIMYR